MKAISSDSVKFNEIFGAWSLEKAVPSSKIAVSQDIGVILLCTLDLSDDTIALIGDFQERADGSTFDAPVEDTGKFYDYVTVLGAPKKVKMFKIVIPPTEADFVRTLKNGATFLIPDSPGTYICDVCHGSPIKCDKCDSTGTITGKRQIRIKW